MMKVVDNVKCYEFFNIINFNMLNDEMFCYHQLFKFFNIHDLIALNDNN